MVVLLLLWVWTVRMPGQRAGERSVIFHNKGKNARLVSTPLDLEGVGVMRILPVPMR